MAIYTYTEASSEIKALLTVKGQTIFTLLNRPEVLLKQIDPTKPKNQYGGLLSIRKYANGTIRMIGLAGRGLMKDFDLTHGRLVVSYVTNNLENAFVRSNGDYFSGRYGRARIKNHRVDIISWEAETGFAMEDVVEELILGWVTVAEQGTIFQGSFGIRLLNETDYNGVVGQPSVAILTRAPVKIDWSQVDLTAHRTAFLAQAEADVLPYLEDAWDNQMIPSNLKTDFNLPLVVLSNPGTVEIGAVFNHLTVNGCETGTGDKSSICCNGGGYMNWDSEPDYTSVEAAAAAGVHVSPYSAAAMSPVAREYSGILIPRLRITGFSPTPNMVSDSSGVTGKNLQKALPDPPYSNVAPGWPETLAGVPAGDALGWVFPGVYVADSGVVKSGDVTLAESFAPLNVANYGAGNISEVAPVDENDPGDATLSIPVGGADLQTSSSSFGQGLIDYIHEKMRSIETEAETECRDDKPFSL